MRAACLFAGLALGCAASASLRATPDVVCAGRTVRLAWDGSASGELSADPADASLGPADASGSKSVRPKLTTTYRFRVSSLFASKTGEARVTVLRPPEKPTPIGAAVDGETAGCSPRSVWVTASVPPDAWDRHLRVNAVSSGDGRAYLVRHLRTSAEVPSGAPSDAFRDQPIAGAWRLETALRPGEVCNSPSMPPSLAIQVTFVCAD
ncbi:MAG: hypothetical protein ACHQ6T_08750 [Myxococcota bacterium]